MFLADLEWRIRPAIVLRQCRLFHKDGRAFAFVSWAYVSDDVAGRLQTMPGRLAPQERRSGSKFMLVDVAAPRLRREDQEEIHSASGKDAEQALVEGFDNASVFCNPWRCDSNWSAWQGRLLTTEK